MSRETDRNKLSKLENHQAEQERVKKKVCAYYFCITVIHVLLHNFPDLITATKI